MSIPDALRFLAAARRDPSLLAGCHDAAGLVQAAEAKGCRVTWPELQEAFRLDWTMRAVRYGFLRPAGRAATRDEVREYFDRATPVIVEDVGHTYQAAILPNGCYRASNLFFAARAGVADGERILDAGCGAGGPAVDLAEVFPRLRVDGITISGEQAAAARRLATERGVGDRVAIHVGDYHACPFADGSFDRVLFLETAGYSDRPEDLWHEVLRLLKPGGTVYLKEPFVTAVPAPGTPARRQMEAVLEIYRYRMRTPEEVCRELRRAGFREVRFESLQGLVTTRLFFTEAMDGTAFGREHRTDLADLPAVYGEVIARR